MGNKLEILTEAVADVTGRRYCSSHRGEAAKELGIYVVRGKVKRWICFSCQAKQQRAAS